MNKKDSYKKSRFKNISTKDFLSNYRKIKGRRNNVSGTRQRVLSDYKRIKKEMGFDLLSFEKMLGIKITDTGYYHKIFLQFMNKDIDNRIAFFDRVFKDNSEYFYPTRGMLEKHAEVNKKLNTFYFEAIKSSLLSEEDAYDVINEYLEFYSKILKPFILEVCDFQIKEINSIESIIEEINEEEWNGFNEKKEYEGFI